MDAEACQRNWFRPVTHSDPMTSTNPVLREIVACDEYARFCAGRLANPYPLLHRLRAEDPVHWSALLGSWVITRYSDAVSGLRDPRISSARVPVFMSCLDEAL